MFRLGQNVESLINNQRDTRLHMFHDTHRFVALNSFSQPSMKQKQNNESETTLLMWNISACGGELGSVSSRGCFNAPSDPWRRSPVHRSAQGWRLNFEATRFTNDTCWKKWPFLSSLSLEIRFDLPRSLLFNN